MSNYDFLFKFIIIGDTGVGKSCLLLQFIQNKIRQNHDVTIGVEFGAKTVQINSTNLKLQIWDTAGQQIFQSITRSYYHNAIGALVVFDLTRRQTFENVKKWIEKVQLYGNPYMKILLVGNKSDLLQQRTVHECEVQSLANLYNIIYVQTNVNDYHKVQRAFLKISQQILYSVQRGDIPIQANYGVKRGKQQEKNISLKNRKFQDFYFGFGCC